MVTQCLLLLYITETGSGRRSSETPVLGLPKARNDPRYLEFTANFTVPTDFGKTGAILVTNLLSSEICLSEIIVHDGSDTILFPGNTWIHSRNDNPEGRIIFTSQVRTSSSSSYDHLSFDSFFFFFCVLTHINHHVASLDMLTFPDSAWDQRTTRKGLDECSW